MWQGAVKRLCNRSKSCHVRKVARLLAQALTKLVAKTYPPRRGLKNLLARQRRGAIWDPTRTMPDAMRMLARDGMRTFTPKPRTWDLLCSYAMDPAPRT